MLVDHRLRENSPRRRPSCLSYVSTTRLIRFNILIVDGTTCVVQPYLPHARGVDSPTIVIDDNTAADGLFPVFGQVFTSMWERSSPVWPSTPADSCRSPSRPSPSPARS
ncbi:DUF5919 domain-containing protein [Streptosporangium sp. NPDC002524]|uniref:DUF5919 domain-containing protein n=1 Tax=Streptosporangium sp. NPDC002524 TaxID=3154537 RepID=UPI003325D625